MFASKDGHFWSYSKLETKESAKVGIFFRCAYCTEQTPALHLEVYLFILAQVHTLNSSPLYEPLAFLLTENPLSVLGIGLQVKK